MKNTTKIDLSSIKFDIYRTRDAIAPDAGYCSSHEMAELVIDRLPAKAMAVIREEIALNGYDKVLNAVATYCRG